MLHRPPASATRISFSLRRLRATAQAAVDPSCLKPEERLAVPTASHDLSVWVFAPSATGAGTPGSMGSQAMSTQPMPHRRLTEAEAFGDLPGGHLGIHQGGQRFAVDSASRRMPIAVNGRQPVLLHPVADRRWMPAGKLADLLPRQSFAEICLQDPCVHDPNTSSGIGRSD